MSLVESLSFFTVSLDFGFIFRFSAQFLPSVESLACVFVVPVQSDESEVLFADW